jgi:hypothetical protein
MRCSLIILFFAAIQHRFCSSKNRFNISQVLMLNEPSNGISFVQPVATAVNGKRYKCQVAWEQQGFGNYNYGRDYKTNGKNARFFDEQGMYKYQFKIPATWKGKNINIVFDGSYDRYRS